MSDVKGEKNTNSKIDLRMGDCLDVLRTIPDDSIDSIVTDPPYGLSFMGKKWDYDVPSTEIWAECLRVLKPGGHLLAFAGTRTQHRMAVRIEDAGFEIRDMIAWVYGSGFPKSLDVSKAIDKLDAADARIVRQFKFTEWIRSTGLKAKQIDQITNTKMGSHYTTHPTQPSIATREFFEMLRPHFSCSVPQWVEEMVDQRTVESENFKRREVVGSREVGYVSEDGAFNDYSCGFKKGTIEITTAHTPAAQQWQGWGTALKPALEPITVARKPFRGTVAANVMEHGTGAINVDGCRVEGMAPATTQGQSSRSGETYGKDQRDQRKFIPSDLGRWPANFIHDGSPECVDLLEGAARFFYCPKASKKDRDEGMTTPEVSKKSFNTREEVDGVKKGMGSDRTTSYKNTHPTVKPTDLMAYLCRLVTPPGGTVLDPFMGSGSTGKAALREGFAFIGIERDENYYVIASSRVSKVLAENGSNVTRKSKTQD